MNNASYINAPLYISYENSNGLDSIVRSILALNLDYEVIIRKSDIDDDSIETFGYYITFKKIEKE